MKFRIKFSKLSDMRFIGHLDLMRCFQRILRISELPVKYSEGFSPHMIMSFAAPLGVGLTSTGEYMDIEMTEDIVAPDALKRLNDAACEGIIFHDMRQIPEGRASNAMAQTAAADYIVMPHPEFGPKEGWNDRIDEFFSLDRIETVKKTKKGEDTADIRPMIYSLQNDGNSIRLTLACGSSANLKCDLVIRAYCEWTGNLAWQPHSFLMERRELYARNDSGELVPLLEAGSLAGKG